MTHTLLLDRESTEPLYQQLQNAIHGNIESGRWPSGYRLPTYRELAEIAGVSLITVQQAVDNLVQEGLLYRRQGLGTFVATQEMKPKSNKIGLFVLRLRDPFFSRLAQAIQSEALNHGYTISVFSLDEGMTQTSRAIELLVDQHPMGIITTAAESDEALGQVADLRRKGIPMVVVDGHLQDAQVDFVQIDNYCGMALLIDHLIELGHRRIGFASDPFITFGVRERIQAFPRILAERGLEFTPALLQVSHLPDDQGGWDAAHKLLALREPPTAIACSHDAIAPGIMRAARELGIRIPQQLSVVGFDDLALSAHLEVPLTTVKQPVEEMGKMAMEMILKRISKPAGEKFECHIVSPELVVRSSSAASPVEKELHP